MIEKITKGPCCQQSLLLVLLLSLLVRCDEMSFLLSQLQVIRHDWIWLNFGMGGSGILPNFRI